MGFCYQGKKLVCDICGHAGARKMKCPVGWCQAYACCPSAECKAKLAKHRREVCQVKCREHSARFKAEREQEAKLLADGQAVRCAAMSQPDGSVLVLFRYADGSSVGKFMAPEVYHKHPMAVPRVIADYAAHGPLVDGPSEFYGGGVSKQVSPAAMLAAIAAANRAVAINAAAAAPAAVQRAFAFSS
jgi:hypothetical protein